VASGLGDLVVFKCVPGEWGLGCYLHEDLLIEGSELVGCRFGEDLIVKIPIGSGN